MPLFSVVDDEDDDETNNFNSLPQPRRSSLSKSPPTLKKPTN